MANRRLYNQKSFVVNEVVEVNGFVSHLVGYFTDSSVISKHDRKYRIRVKPDSRWIGVREVAFHADSVYECEGVAYRSRRHIYGSEKWYISPQRPKGKLLWQIPGEFTFEEFDVLELKIEKK